MARLFFYAPLAAILISVSFSCGVVASKEFTPIHAKYSTAAFSHWRQPRRISWRQRASVDVPHNAWHVNSSRGRTSVVCHSSVLEPMITSTSVIQRILSHGVATFMSNWKAYSLIPFIAGFVGWFTNYLAVQMIFYPIRWRGIPIYRVEGEPLGLLGWQGM